MTLQDSKFQPVRESPLRVYARERIAMASVDQIRGVLQRRIAVRLFWQQKQLLNHATDFDNAKPNEQEFYLSLARQVLALVDDIESKDPPTAGEIARYEADKAMVLARQRARLDAAQQQHRLGQFRPDPDRASETARCERCGAGVSIHLGTAVISACELLTDTCQPSSVPGGSR